MRNTKYPKKNDLSHYPGVKLTAFWTLLFLLPLSVKADIAITDGIHAYSSLADTVVTMSGVSELHITSSTTPISGCTIHLNSPDSFFFLENIRPSVVNSTYLSQIRVNGSNAVLNTNVRIVEYAAGAVVIPHSSTFQPLQVFTGDNFQGNSTYLSQYTAYNTSSLGTMASSISSFILKRGYTATFAQTENGTGYSKNYVAQDCDLEIGVLPTKLNDKINFIRVFPWRWTSKKGIGGNIGSNLNVKWWYNWNLDQNSTLDKEYVPIRQNRWWPSMGQNWQTRGASHLLGYNEPDSTNQANITVGDAIWSWPDLLGTGLRVGSPATTDGRRSSWLYPFIQQADAADLRVDFVAVHYYWCYDPANPSGAATQMYNYLKAVYDQTNRPIWITEWNNGANWTGCSDPTYAQQAAAVRAMINMLDNTPWVERYAIYNWVEDCRRVEWDDGWPTEAGIVYRDQVSPVGYVQEVCGSGKSANAIYTFDEHFRDCSGNGNNPLFYGAPKRTVSPGGNALVLDGVDDYLVLPTHMGEETDFTFAAWVYWNGGDLWQRILDFGNNTTQYMFLTPASGDNTLRFAITTSGNGANEQKIETTRLATGQWVHIAVTLNGNTGTLYVNGSPEASNTAMTINPSDFQPAINYLGKSQWSADPLFDGMLDTVVIADYALSREEIATLITSGQPAQFITAPLEIAGSSAGSEQTGNPAVNSYDRNRKTRWCNDGTVANAWINYDLGQVCEVENIRLRFYQGHTRTYPIKIEIDGVQVFSGITSMTSGYWERAISPVSGRHIKITMTGNNSAGSGWFSIWEAQVWSHANEPPAFLVNPVLAAVAVERTLYSSTLADDAEDPEGDVLTFSKDYGPDWLTVFPDGTFSGIPLNSNTGENVFTVRVTDTGGLYDTAEMRITVSNIYSGTQGMDDLLGFASQWLMVDCEDIPGCGGADLDDDAAVTGLDFSILARNWQGDETLQLYLRFDETSGTTAEDDSIYQRNGLLVNGPVWSSGIVNGALSFDGANDYVRVHGYNGITGMASRTCAAWIKTTKAGSQILNWGSTQVGQKWTLRVNDDGTFRTEISNGYCYGTTSINDGAWHHVAVVLANDGSPDISEAVLYVDGVRESAGGVLSCPVNTSGANEVKIGVDISGINSFFAGLMDDVYIFNIALSEAQIKDLYTGSQSASF